MLPTTAQTITDRERAAIESGQATIYRGRVIPIMRGGDETAEEKAEREAAEAKTEHDKDKTFSQADVDRIVQERLARAKSTPPDDYEDLKAAKAKLDELEAANATELEKATKRAEAAEQAAAKATADAKETRLKSAILAEAAKSDRKVVDPEAVLTLLDRSTLELDDDGAPKNIAQAMDSLLTAKPYLVGDGGKGRADGGADQGARGGGENQLTSTEGMSPTEIAKAVEEGRLNDYLKTSK